MIGSVNGTLYSYYGKNISRGTCQVVQRPCLEAPWTSRKYYIRQRSAVYSRDDKGVEQAVRDIDKTVYGLPPLDRWADREGKPGVGTVSKGLH